MNVAIAEHWRWRRRWEPDGRTCSFTLWLAAELPLLRTHSPVTGRAAASGPFELRQQAAELSAPLSADAGDQILSAWA